MKSFGGRLLRGAGRLGLWSLIPLFVFITVWTTVLPAFVASTALPEITPQDKAAIEQAAKSPGGQKLTSTGFKATIKISDEGIIKLLDQEEKKAGQANPGPYILFSRGEPHVKEIDDNAPFDAIVDVANGAIVALSQEFIDSKGELDRGSVCYNVKTIDVLAGNWKTINVYLHGKSLNQQIPVTRELVPDLTSGFPDTQCYVYKAG